jgi:gluconokinase
MLEGAYAGFDRSSERRFSWTGFVDEGRDKGRPNLRRSDGTIPRTVNPDLFVVMGVCGSGKTRIGSALAREFGLEFVEGDDYHPPENVARMHAGIPLTDDDRAGWLRSLAGRLAEARNKGSGLMVACSALKRKYRDVLRGAASDVQFVHLSGSRALLAERLAARQGHFMPASLLDSQLAALEEPSSEEGAWVVDVAETPDEIAARLAARIESRRQPDRRS